MPLPEPDAPAVIGYTSGTTGRSKGALLLHRNLLANAAPSPRPGAGRADDRLLLALPLFHTHGLMVGLHGTLLTGASAVICAASSTPRDVLATLRDDPSHHALLRRADDVRAAGRRDAGRGRAAPRCGCSSRAPRRSARRRLRREFERRFGQRILERYGMTETIMNAVQPLRGRAPAGHGRLPVPGRERAWSLRTRDVADASGEIEVRGPQRLRRLLGAPDATAEASTPTAGSGPATSAASTRDGYFTITGRAKELIISGGYNVYPREVEEVLADASRRWPRSRWSARRIPTWASRSSR